MEKRFQECNRLQKFFRYRYYISIPFEWCYIIIKNIIKSYFSKELKNYQDLSKKAIWGILVGEAQIKMKWYFTQEEVFKNFKNLKHK